MRFRKLSFRNFKSFLGDGSIDFDRNPGLYFVTGDNQHDPRLGANGAGKSTLFDALCWALYGKSLRGLRAGKLRSWNAPPNSSYFTTLELDLHGKAYEIRREWNPSRQNAIIVRSEGFDRNVSQEELEDLLGLSYDAFCCSIVVGQFGKTLIDLPPADKLSLLTSVLDLDQWITYSETASSLCASVDNEIRSKEKNLSYCVGKMSSLREKQKELEIEIERRKERLRDLVREREERIKIQVDKKAELEVLLRDIEALRKRLKKKLDRTHKDRDEIEEAIDRVFAEYGQLETFIKVDKEKESDLEDLINRLNKAVEIPKCPYCLQKVSPDHVAEEIARLDKELGDLKKMIADKIAKKKRLASKINEAKEVVERIKEKERSLSSEINKAESEANIVRHELREVDSLIKALQNEILEIEEELAKSDEIIIKGEKEIAKLEAEIKRIEETLCGLKKKRELYKYWIRGFKHVRLFLLDEALSMLELETNNMLSSLGLVEWTVRYEIKGSGPNRGIKVSIVRPGTKSSIPWESWSGGETQRIRLASTLAFANIVAFRSGVSPSLLALDEPTHHLDSDGIADLIESLRTFAKEQERCVWLIDHHTLDFGGFDGVIKVVKDEDGVSYLQEVEVA